MKSVGADDATIDGGVGRMMSMIEEVGRKVDVLVRALQGKVKPLLTVEEVAEVTGRAPYTVRSWIKSGRIRAERVHGTGPRGRLLIPAAEIDKLVAGGLGAAVPAVAVGTTVAASLRT